MSSARAQNGVLAVTSTQTSANTVRPAVKPSMVRLKVIVRRLAPGLTESEFVSILGEEWKAGGGKVDYFLYKPGKDSKDPSKPSRPSRAYLHLTDETHLQNLSDVVRQSSFEDAQNTITSPCLIGPPTLEYAPYARIPASRSRADPRAGTIDLDPDFINFLEALTSPASSAAVDAPVEAPVTKKEKVTTTPLVQFLKDKKASKNKDAAVKAAKKQEVHLAKAKSAKEEDTKKRGKDFKGDRIVDKSSKEAVKILNREGASKLTTASSAQSEASGTESSTPKLGIGKVHGRQRGVVIAAHIRMLERDLGLSPAQAHRQVKRDTAAAQKAEKAAALEKSGTPRDSGAASATQSQPVPTASKVSSNASTNRRGRVKGPALDPGNSKGVGSSNSTASSAGSSTPVVLLKKPEVQQPAPIPPTPQPARQSTGKSRPPVVAPSDGATQAFIKHANPSQGVTEALLKEAMERFGVVSMVEIDRRKGFAYVDFVDTAGLKKAMAANPIAVAQGTVQVMQRKGTSLPPEKKVIHQAHQAHQSHQVSHAPSRGGRGGRGGAGRRGGRGGARGGAQAGNEAGKVPSAPVGPAAK